MKLFTFCACLIIKDELDTSKHYRYLNPFTKKFLWKEKKNGIKNLHFHLI